MLSVIRNAIGAATLALLPGSRHRHTHIAMGGTLAFAIATATAAAGPVTHFDLSGLPLSSPAGTVVTLTVTAEDATNAVVTTYTGTIHFSSTDFLAILPSDYTFTPFDDGTQVFPVVFRTPGSQSITVTDTTVATITGSATTTVLRAAVPEPGTSLLLLSALGFLGSSMICWRKST
jgi:hypothetical protein